jgi:hypothetical protein
MNDSQIQAMSRLAAANPYLDAGSLSKWTEADEDNLLEFLLADAGDLSVEVAPSDKSNSSTSPTRPHRIKRIAFLPVALSVAGGVAFAVDFVGSGAPAAFADWTATTTTPPASQLAAADSSCIHSYGLLSQSVPSAVRTLGPDSGPPESMPPLRITDSRGPYELLLYSDQSSSFVCFWAQESGFLSLGGGSETQPPSATHSIGVPVVPFTRNADGSGYTMAYGNAGSQVTGVTLNLSDGTSVEATVQNGLFAAWWPSRTDVASAVVTTSDGTYHQDFGDIGPNNMGPAQVEK